MSECRITLQPDGQNYCDRCGKFFPLLGKKPCQMTESLSEFTAAVEPFLIEKDDAAVVDLSEFTDATKGDK